MNRDVILNEIATELCSNENLCEVYNDLAQMRRECGPEDHLWSIEEILKATAQQRANALGYHFLDWELEYYFVPEVNNSEHHYEVEIEEDDLPF